MGEMIPDQQGRIVIHTITNPGAGVEFTVMLPVRVRWRVFMIYARFLPDANVITRSVRLVVGKGSVVYGRLNTTRNPVASINVNFTWYMAGHAYIPSGGNEGAGALPEKLLMNNMMTIKSSTTNLQVGDEWKDVTVMAEEWMEPLA